MKNSGERTNGTTQPADGKHRAIVSDRKLKANRENAKKSTGPKTPIGKAYSRWNAVKHGLFCSPDRDCAALREDPQQYEEMIDGLWEQYQPVGKAEEIEVERIAVCCWRLRRSWRYENAVNLAARRDFVRKELAYQEEYCKERDKEEHAIVLELQTAQEEIKNTGEISPEQKQRIVALEPEFDALWSLFYSCAQQRLQLPDVSGEFQKLSPELQSWVLAMVAARTGILRFDKLSSQRWTNVIETAVGQHAIPNSEALDRLLRYETTIERSLTRALDRLDRLQRRRMRPPALPLSARLTQ